MARLSHILRLTGRWIGVLFLVSGAGVVFASEGAPWSYTGATGPEFWGKLSPDYALCASGQEQSPVDIPAGAPVNTADLGFAYKAAPLEIENNGHTIEVVYQPGSTITLDGTPYTLNQFHFHTRSEHAVAGQHTPMELHLVHKSATGAITVVGVLLKEGKESPAYAAVFQNIPTQPGPAREVPGASVDAAALLPATRTYWRYDGSLTTPPCTQDVNWVVMTEPVEVSAAQIAAFTAAYQDNERPLQAFNSRAFISAPATLPATGGAAVSGNEALAGAGLLMMAAGLALVLTLRRRG